MAGTVDARLQQLGITLPRVVAPLANYVPVVRTGNLMFVSGQITILNGKVEFVGKLGREFTVEQGKQAARLCALNVIAQMRLALDGDLDRVVRCVRVCGYVNGLPEFTEQPAVVNGASDVIVEVFGDAGRHSRAAVGMASLPMGVAAEVEAVFEVK